jgi:hypothetical protein
MWNLISSNQICALKKTTEVQLKFRLSNNNKYLESLKTFEESERSESSYWLQLTLATRESSFKRHEIQKE